jgi:parallel beta-helix repeat protein
LIKGEVELKRLISGVVLAMLMVNVLALSFNVKPARSSPATITVPDDYSTIQAAINAANPGDTIAVSSGTYYENVVVNKTVSLIGENRNSTTIVGVVNSPIWETVIDVWADDVTISNLTVVNGGDGIHLAARRSKVVNCTAYGNSDGITISKYSTYPGPCQNYLRNNLLFNNSYDLFLLGSWSLDDFINDIDTSNLVNGKPVYYLVNKHDITINPVTFPDAGYVAIINSTNVQISNFSFSNNSDGLLIAFSPNTLVENIEARNNFNGISVMCSPRTAIKNCSFSINTSGIFLYYSDNATINGNSISNAYDGIYLISSNECVVYHNNFINNMKQVYLHESVGAWDSGYPSGGNYWSDYNGTDMYSGPGQNLTGSDSIGDTPYTIDSTNVDHYPLMNPVIPEFPSAMAFSLFLLLLTLAITIAYKKHSRMP